MNEDLKPTIEGSQERGLGRLVAARGEVPVQLPLQGVKIIARTGDRAAQVTIEQTFHNPFPEALEAVYIFPLSANAAISRLEFRVDGRVIKGVVKEREEARKAYQNAVQDGKRAVLLEQDRREIFTLQVGNIPAGQAVSVRLEYSEWLPFFDDGSTEFRLPLVVAPRYIPGNEVPKAPVGDGVAQDTDQVPDASRITPPVLAEGFDPEVSLSIEVEIEGGACLDLESSQHAIRLSGGKVALARQNELLDRDFILRWRLVEAELRTTARVTQDGFGMISLVAPRRKQPVDRPRDVVFVVDRSGSMSGGKMESAARACSLLLGTLKAEDRFAIVVYDDKTEWFGEPLGTERRFIFADGPGRKAGEEFLKRINARGGTELYPAIAQALDLAGDAGCKGRAVVLVILTDGQVGNEEAVFKQIQQDAGCQIFTVGIDTAVNQGFLEKLAYLGGGTCNCVVPGAALEQAVARIEQEIGVPVVSSLSIEGAEEITPRLIPHLFPGRALAVFFSSIKGKKITVRGTLSDGQPFVETLTPRKTDMEALRHLWAKGRVADLEDERRVAEYKTRGRLEKKIVALSIRHTLLTAFTSFVAVDEREVVNKKGKIRKVVQPVHLPFGWKNPHEGVACFVGAAGARGFQGSMGPQGAAGPQGSMGISYCYTAGVVGSQAQVYPTTYPCPPTFGQAPSTFGQAALTVGEAFQALQEAIRKVRLDLAAGTRPQPEPVDEARKALQKLFSESPDLGIRHVSLQRLLRTLFSELVALLKGNDREKLGEILGKCEKELGRWPVGVGI